MFSSVNPTKEVSTLIVLMLASVWQIGTPVRGAVLSGEKPKLAARRSIVKSFGKLPLSFELNQGQAKHNVKFQSRGVGYQLFITARGLGLVLKNSAEKSKAADPATTRKQETYELEPSVVQMQFVGANAATELVGEVKLPGTVNYYFGRDSRKWSSQIPTYARVRHESVFPGVDVVYYGNHGQLEFDFVLAPGADPSLIRLRFSSTDKLAVDPQGDLVVSVGEEEIKLKKPLIHQKIAGVRKAISGYYMVKDVNEVGLHIDTYDSSEALVIDPVLVYSTYLGGSDFDEGNGIAVDANGDVYVTGETWSANFPTQSALQGGFSGGQNDVFVTKFNASGDTLLYSTYLGGSDDEFGLAIAVDAQGNAYVTGETDSGDAEAVSFPITEGAFQPSSLGSDAFVTKLRTDGSLVYSTYLGGNQPDRGRGITVDSSGNAYVTGVVRSDDFPTTGGAFQGAKAAAQDAFVIKLNASGSALVYSTFLGGDRGDEGHAIAVDPAGNAWVAGETGSRDETMLSLLPQTPFRPHTVGAWEMVLPPS